MKKIRLLQIAVYVAFTALFLQNAAADVYRGFMDGLNDGRAQAQNPVIEPPIIPSVLIDGASVSNLKSNTLKLNDNYSLENVNISADIKLKPGVENKSRWLLIFKLILIAGTLYLLVRTAYVINKIIYNIYAGKIFQREAVKMMRETGVLLVIYFAADYVFQQLTYLESTMLLNAPFKIINTSSFNFVVLIGGLLTLIIADAFKEAAQLKEEQELTI